MTDNVQAFLDCIAACEGTGNAYNALFGYTPRNGKVFANDYIKHPNIRAPFTQTDGTLNYTTAAGRYQFLYSTWTRLAKKLNLYMFTPADQDAGAIELLAECGAMPFIKSGDLQSAIDKASGIWASLPSSKYLQPKRTLEFAENAYTEAGGSIA